MRTNTEKAHTVAYPGARRSRERSTLRTRLARQELPSQHGVAIRRGRGAGDEARSVHAGVPSTEPSLGQSTSYGSRLASHLDSVALPGIVSLICVAYGHCLLRLAGIA